MSKQSIAIINANVVYEGSINQRDVLIDSGRIKQINNQFKFGPKWIKIIGKQIITNKKKLVILR